MKPRNPFASVTTQDLYPSSFARGKADEVFDRLPLTTPIGEAIRLWELRYLEAGGHVVVPKALRR